MIGSCLGPGLEVGMNGDPSTSTRILDLICRCLDCYNAMYAGSPEGYLEAAGALSRLAIPEALPADGRIPANVARLSPAQCVGALLYDAGNYLNEMKRYDEAVPLLSKVVELAPRDADAHRELAVSMSATNRDATALEHFQQYVSLCPSDVSGWLGCGDCLLKLGRYRDGKTAYLRARTIDPNHPVIAQRLQVLDKYGI